MKLSIIVNYNNEVGSIKTVEFIIYQIFQDFEFIIKDLVELIKGIMSFE